jgi:biopolymer transport protein ExbD
VLVIVFLVAMPAIHPAIKIDVPQAGGSKPAEHPAQLDVSVRANGTLFWGIGENALRSRFEQASHANPQPELRLAADRKVPYERVAEVMSAAQAGGLTKIGFVMFRGLKRGGRNAREPRLPGTCETDVPQGRADDPKSSPFVGPAGLWLFTKLPLAASRRLRHTLALEYVHQALLIMTGC